MTPMQRTCITFPDRNALSRRIGRLDVALSVAANPDRSSGSWCATVRRADGSPVGDWNRDDKVLAARHLKRLLRGVGEGDSDELARGTDFIGLTRELTDLELERMAPPLPPDVRVERDTPELGALRRLMLWIAYAMARKALGTRHPPKALPASSEERSTP